VNWLGKSTNAADTVISVIDITTGGLGLVGVLAFPFLIGIIGQSPSRIEDPPGDLMRLQSKH